MANERRKPDIWRGFITKGLGRIKAIESFDLVNKKLQASDFTDPDSEPAAFRFVVKIKGFDSLRRSYLIDDRDFPDVVQLFTDAEMTKWAIRDPKELYDLKRRWRLFSWNRWGKHHWEKGPAMNLTARDRQKLAEVVSSIANG